MTWVNLGSSIFLHWEGCENMKLYNFLILGVYHILVMCVCFTNSKQSLAQIVVLHRIVRNMPNAIHCKYERMKRGASLICCNPQVTQNVTGSSWLSLFPLPLPKSKLSPCKCRFLSLQLKRASAPPSFSQVHGKFQVTDFLL